MPTIHVELSGDLMCAFERLCEQERMNREEVIYNAIRAMILHGHVGEHPRTVFND